VMMLRKLLILYLKLLQQPFVLLVYLRRFICSVFLLQIYCNASRRQHVQDLCSLYVCKYVPQVIQDCLAHLSDSSYDPVSPDADYNVTCHTELLLQV